MNKHKKTLPMDARKPFNTLFIDRDGVINVYRPNDYVKSVAEFVFIEGALESIARLSSLFQHLIIVTNQRGVGKGVMRAQDLEEIHAYMLQQIEAHQGRIDRIYCCTATDENHPCRKPNPGMIRQAMLDFPKIRLEESWLAGDSLSDMQLAQNAGIKAILIGNRYAPEEIKAIPIDAHYVDFFTFAKEIIKETP